MRLISSDLALRLLIALVAGRSCTLTNLARALGVTASSAKRGLEILVDDGLVAKLGIRYEVSRTPLGDLVIDMAAEVLDPIDQIRVIAAASGQVEFVGEDTEILVVIFARGSEPLLESQASRLMIRPVGRLGKRLVLQAHDEVRRELEEEPSARMRYLGMKPIYGDRDRAFPDRSSHGSPPGRLLRGPHPGLRLPSKRALNRMRKRFGVRKARLFGSAVRSDFKAGSDLDVAIELDDRPTLASMLDLEAEMERIFDRDVDLVLDAQVKPALRRAIDREGVDLIR